MNPNYPHRAIHFGRRASQAEIANWKSRMTGEIPQEMGQANSFVYQTSDADRSRFLSRRKNGLLHQDLATIKQLLRRQDHDIFFFAEHKPHLHPHFMRNFALEMMRKIRLQHPFPIVGWSYQLIPLGYNQMVIRFTTGQPKGSRNGSSGSSNNLRNSPETLSHLKTLGITLAKGVILTPDNFEEIVQKPFRELAKNAHPDRPENVEDKARIEEYKAMTQAYRTLEKLIKGR